MNMTYRKWCLIIKHGEITFGSSHHQFVVLLILVSQFVLELFEGSCLVHPHQHSSSGVNSFLGSKDYYVEGLVCSFHYV
jgi:hypothetical protein